MCLLLLWSLGDEVFLNTSTEHIQLEDWAAEVGRGDTAEFSKHNSLVLGICNCERSETFSLSALSPTMEKEL